MRRKLRIAAIILGVLLVLVLVGLYALYRALLFVPETYVEAMNVDPVVQKRASDEMLSQTSAFVSDVKRRGRWEVLYTAEQINGWLAVDLIENHASLLPEGFSDPRVSIEPGRVTLFGRVTRDNRSVVVTLTVEPYLAEPNVVGVRICDVRAGKLPLPMDQVLQAISDSSMQGGFPLEWQQSEGQPVALITVPVPPEGRGKKVSIDKLRLDEDAVYVSGETE